MAATRTRLTPVDKHERRRRELAESALRTLGELGYARTSLRDIAANSPFSHGVLHYYFADKVELIVYCLERFATEWVSRYDPVVACQSEEELADAFGNRLVGSISDHNAMLLLWYDLRVQSMFEPRLRGAVLEVDAALVEMGWRIVLRYSELAGRPPGLDPVAAYGVLDGVFQQALLCSATWDEAAQAVLRQRMNDVLPLLLDNPVDAVR